MNYQEALEKLKNMTPLRITVSGDIGSGKSSFTKHLAEELGVTRIYAGGIFREEAQRRELALDDFGALCQQDESVDHWLDELMRQKSKINKRGVFEGRTAWHFVEKPDVKVFLRVDPKTAAERVWGDQDNPLRVQHDSLEEVQAANVKRKASEQARYEKYYQIDVYDENNYDVVIDTSKMTIDEVFETTVIKIAEFLP